MFHSRLNWFGLSKTQNVENTGSRELPKRQSENWWKTETPRKVNSPWYPHGLFWRSLEYADRYHQCLGVQSGCFLGLGYLLYLACCCWMICQHSKNAWSRKLSGRNTEGVPEVKKTLPWKCKNPQMVPILPDLDKDFLFSGFWGLCEVIGFIKTCLCHTYLYIYIYIFACVICMLFSIHCL